MVKQTRVAPLTHRGVFLENDFGLIGHKKWYNHRLVIWILSKILRFVLDCLFEGVFIYGSRLHSLAIARSVTAIADGGGHQPPT